MGSQLALANSTSDQKFSNNPKNFAPPPRSKTHGVNTSRPSYSFGKAGSSREALAVIPSRSSSRSASPKKKTTDPKPLTSNTSTPKTVAQEVTSESHKKAHIDALSRSTTFRSKTSLTPRSIESFNNAPNSPLYALTFTTPTQVTTSASNIHSSGEFAPHSRNGEPNESQPLRSTKPTMVGTMPTITETENEPAAPLRMGMEDRFEKSPMAELIREYSSATIESQLGPTETSIILVLSLEELTLDLIVDRVHDRNKSLPRYHLARATLSNVTPAVTAQQIFLQQAAALVVERHSHFIVDPGDTLIPILQGTSSLPQLYVAWRALITRVKLGVKAWEKYIAEYKYQADAAVLSPLSTLQELYDPLKDIKDTDSKLRYLYSTIPHHK